MSSSGGSSGNSGSAGKLKEKARLSRTSQILWHAHQNDASAVRKLLEEDGSLVNARDYDNRTPLHVASLLGWIEVAKCLLEFGADVNSQDRWRNTPLADAEGAKKHRMMELLKSYGGLSYGQNGSHFEPRPVPPPQPNKCDWEIDPSELDFSHSNIIGKGSFGEILKATWRGTPVAVKRILPSLSDDRLVIQDFRHEVNLLVKPRHPNIVQFLGAVTEKKPLMLITEYLRGGDLHQYLKEKNGLNSSAAVNFAMDIARMKSLFVFGFELPFRLIGSDLQKYVFAMGMAYLHNEPNVIIHRDLKPRNVLLVNSSADHLKVGDFGLSKLIKVQNSHDVYKMTGETGSYRYMAPEVFKHRKYDKKVDVFSFAMVFYEMIEGEPPFANHEPYEAAKFVADGHRPNFRSKSFVSELRDLTGKCWAPDMNHRPTFLDILKTLEKTKENGHSDHSWHIFNP
ncbi:transmembrane emp24 domain-containing protein p24delta9-like [Hibiscus syriacus]|uniref:Transmembrane emp24 domain-containing protein p24delta9-like n=1 Tax=Hibiscus syriacus TaxID=106335 RepID=A0A6A3CRY6_HIBSY|nr:transmembrane emp24 domain-containing protein p24delta9-like [Hibiscus syriacus]